MYLHAVVTRTSIPIVVLQEQNLSQTFHLLKKHNIEEWLSEFFKTDISKMIHPKRTQHFFCRSYLMEQVLAKFSQTKQQQMMTRIDAQHDPMLYLLPQYYNLTNDHNLPTRQVRIWRDQTDLQDMIFSFFCCLALRRLNNYPLRSLNRRARPALGPPLFPR